MRSDVLARVATALARPDRTGRTLVGLLDLIAEVFNTECVVYRREFDPGLWYPTACSTNARARMRNQIHDCSYVAFSAILEDLVRADDPSPLLRAVRDDDLSENFMWNSLPNAGRTYTLCLFTSNEPNVAEVAFNESLYHTLFQQVSEAVATALRGFERARQLSGHRRRASVHQSIASHLQDVSFTGEQWTELLASEASRFARGSRAYVISFSTDPLVNALVSCDDYLLRRAPALKSYLEAEPALRGWDAPRVVLECSISEDPVLRRIESLYGSTLGVSLMSAPIRGTSEELIGVLLVVGGSNYCFDRIDLENLVELSSVAAAGLVLRISRDTAAEEGRFIRLLASALDQAAEGIAVTDLKDRYLYANNAYLKMHGYRFGELDGADDGISYTPSDYRSYLELRKSITPATGPLIMEAKRFRKDGSSFDSTVFIGTLSDREGSVLGTIISVVDSTDRSKTIQLLRKQAIQDPLTGLYNRRGLMEYLEKLLNDASRLSMVGVVYVDIDRFKPINDTYGHAAGDELLRVVGSRLTGALRAGDLAGRLGGDEFLVIVPNLASRADGQRMADRIAEKLFSEPVTIADHRIRFAASLGVAFAFPGMTTVEELVDLADKAMYQSKLSSRAVVVSGGASLHSPHVMVEQELGERLKEALRNPATFGLRIVYEPVYNLPLRRITGLSTSPMWNDPEIGQVRMADLSRAAETTRQTVELSDWIIDAVLADLRSWQTQVDNPVAGIVIALKIFTPILFDQSSLAHILDRARAIALAGHDVIFEFSESALASDDVQPVLAGLRQIREQGWRVSVDEFGLHAPLQATISTQVHELLLRPSSQWDGWISDSEFLTIASTVAHAIGAQIICQGVSSAEELQVVRHRVGLIQGPLVGSEIVGSDVPYVIRRAASDPL